jgi:hypothetical protein
LVLNLSGENSDAHASPEEIFFREKVFDNVPDNGFALIEGTLERSACAKGWAAAARCLYTSDARVLTSITSPR